MCPSGSYIVGLHARYGDWIDRLWIICADWNSHERKLGEPKRVDQAVGTSRGGGDEMPADCAGFQALQTISMAYLRSDNHFVDNIAITCATLEPPHQAGYPKSIDTHDEVIDPPPAAMASCPEGELATGIHGLADEFIYSVGLTCEPAPGPAPKPQVPYAERLKKGLQQGGVGGIPDRQKVLKGPGFQ